MLARPGRGGWDKPGGAGRGGGGSALDWVRTVRQWIRPDGRIRSDCRSIPDDAVFLHDCQSAVLKTDASRIDVILAFQFLELQAGMRRIAIQETGRRG